MSHPTRRTTLLAGLAAGAVAAALAASPTATASQTATVAANPAIDRVVAISIDGLRPDAITSLGASKVPNLYRMINEGATTLNARTMVEQTVTLPNHTSMVTGTRIDKTAGGHGVTVNSDTGTTVQASAGRYVSSIFDVVHDRGGRTGLYVAKDKFNVLDRSWNATNGAPDTTGTDEGRDKIDTYRLTDSQGATTALTTTLGSTSPDTFSFLHIALPDSAGHSYGWMSSRYLTAVEQSDALLGQVLKTIDGNAARKADTAVVLTADHGGSGTSHSTTTTRENYTIPFMVWGSGVAAGADLYALNGTSRANPGTAKTSYSGTQPVRNGDLANLTADLLDLPSVPGSQFDTAQDLTVFPAG
ncbi:type I phosphodiesterase/nucleotide pyrophosphatase [Knoellia remsis]|uniref:Type I phosphodiesterase/nucleotide pyrophosphatase n=1 Tax=Knoellia remsis TaxID=407159 RepID=A0A2T0UK19_9MICO|nr:alkaline phosphatase family protein [Knoellia remsis]PRY58234.1 type I phosphodiesterase/nucleotide pyrophosphatase [Knoellia remsis]